MCSVLSSTFQDHLKEIPSFQFYAVKMVFSLSLSQGAILVGSNAAHHLKIMQVATIVCELVAHSKL